ncbi:MAG: hypothetical protein WAV41_03230 [Microgenomates group bacterium]
MAWRDQLQADLFGEGSVMNRLPRVQDQTETRVVEVPDGYDVQEYKGGVAIVPVRPKENMVVVFAQAVEKRSVSALWGGLLNRFFANGLNLLPDDDKMQKEFDNAPKGILGSLDALRPRNLVAGVIWGGEKESQQRAQIARNRLASAIDATMNESQIRLSRPVEVMRAGEAVLGKNISTVHAAAEVAQFRSGVRQDVEREMAANIVSTLQPVLSEISIRKEVENTLSQRKAEIVYEVGQRALLREEVTRLKGIIGNPTVAVAECKEGVTLVKSGFLQQLAAFAFGAKGFQLMESLAGGQELYISKDGRVHMRTGVEDEVVASNITELLTQTDIAPHFENLKAVAKDRRLKLGPVNEWIFNIATRKGREKIHAPGTLKVQRSGANEEDVMVVTDVVSAANGIGRVTGSARRGGERVKQLTAAIPHIDEDEQTYCLEEIALARRDMSVLPRHSEVVKEAISIVDKLEKNDDEILQSAGFSRIDENNLKLFAKSTPVDKQRIRDIIASKYKSEELADKVITVLNRRSSQYNT